MTALVEGAIITTLDFETPGGYTTSTGEFIVLTPGGFLTPEARDSFIRTDGSDLGTEYILSNLTGSYFTAEDVDGQGGPTPVLLSFSTPIANYTDLGFNFSAAEDDQLFLTFFPYEAWGVNDYVHIDYQIDGTGYQNLLWFASDSDTSAPAVDTDFDGVGDSTIVTNAFQDFASSITGTGTSLDIRVTFNLNAADVDFAIDNLQVTGTLIPEPASYAAVVGLIGMVLVLRRRKMCNPVGIE